MLCLFGIFVLLLWRSGRLVRFALQHVELLHLSCQAPVLPAMQLRNMNGTQSEALNTQFSSCCPSTQHICPVAMSGQVL
jgi:hypothetical protein